MVIRDKKMAISMSWGVLIEHLYPALAPWSERNKRRGISGWTRRWAGWGLLSHLAHLGHLAGTQHVPQGLGAE